MDIEQTLVVAPLRVLYLTTTIMEASAARKVARAFQVRGRIWFVTRSV